MRAGIGIDMLPYILLIYSAVWNSLPKTVLSNDSVAVFKSRLKTFLFSQASLFFLCSLTRYLAPTASEVTTLWRYTNLFIIIIITAASLHI